MGHSITEFRGQAFGTNDFKLDVWLKLLARTLTRENVRPDWLVEARDHWTQVGDWGVGCIDARLDYFLIDQERIEIVSTLSQLTLRFLEEQGPVLTGDFLNELVAAGPENFFTRDLEAETFASVGRAFLRLVRGQFDPKTPDVQWF